MKKKSINLYSFFFLLNFLQSLCTVDNGQWTLLPTFGTRLHCALIPDTIVVYAHVHTYVHHHVYQLNTCVYKCTYV